MVRKKKAASKPAKPEVRPQFAATKCAKCTATLEKVQKMRDRLNPGDERAALQRVLQWLNTN